MTPQVARPQKQPRISIPHFPPASTTPNKARRVPILNPASIAQEENEEASLSNPFKHPQIDIPITTPALKVRQNVCCECEAHSEQLPTSSGKPRVTEEERRAILDRRKSMKVDD